MPSRGSRLHTNPELGDFLKGRESQLNKAILRVLANRPGLNIYGIRANVSASDFGPVNYPTVYRRVMDLFENPFWWLHVQGYVRSSRNPNMSSRAFSLSLQGVLAAVALYYEDTVMVSNLKRNYDLYFPIYFANRLQHPLADEWLFRGIGEAFRNGLISINMSWDYFMINATFHLARRRRMMEKEEKSVGTLGIDESLFARFWKDTTNLPQSGWDKVTRMYDPKNGIDRRAIELLKPQSSSSSPSP
jgi:hypothetical protein